MPEGSDLFRFLYLEPGRAPFVAHPATAGHQWLPGRWRSAPCIAPGGDKGIPIAVNFCSFTNKLLQLRVRRKALAALHQKPYERLDGEVIETVLAFTAPDNYAWMHPDEVERLKGKRVGQRFFLLRRVAPLILDDPGRLLAVQEVT